MILNLNLSSSSTGWWQKTVSLRKRTQLIQQNNSSESRSWNWNFMFVVNINIYSYFRFASGKKIFQYFIMFNYQRKLTNDSHEVVNNVFNKFRFLFLLLYNFDSIFSIFKKWKFTFADLIKIIIIIIDHFMIKTST